MENEDRKYLFVDIETTGLEPGVHVPLSIGMILDRTENDPEPLELVVTIKPTEEQWKRASEGALAVNGFTWEKLQEEGVSPEEAKETISRWLYENDISADTVVYIGQNPRFDVAFLRYFMESELNWLDFPLTSPVDTIQLARSLAEKDPSIRFENFKGWGIARALGVEEEGALHTAIGGVQACKRNYYALMERLTKLTA